MTELHTHCQCDNCSGIDCCQDNPEEYAANEKKREGELIIKGIEMLMNKLSYSNTGLPYVYLCDIETSVELLIEEIKVAK